MERGKKMSESSVVLPASGLLETKLLWLVLAAIAATIFTSMAIIVVGVGLIVFAIWLSKKEGIMKEE
ncbi:hypothetical protein A3H38_06685 [candidate division WOR-1 bacterium RIFCSPLOWO2_02_FULL_46_20]|uniref:Uncharacterized protein n=1 Tax=candidate division WOR-1 bacterium RIFCSPLOWO2_02_FULL_46_20 TaxID=1802567 RepID=A0A1F4RCE3_UNCSA|nr:MAG: hypothetical protein A3H38_06685 [candidate division WOR-1 bacterium RIFCSPLOWO2_02_FULL_46_20]